MKISTTYYLVLNALVILLMSVPLHRVASSHYKTLFWVIVLASIVGWVMYFVKNEFSLSKKSVKASIVIASLYSFSVLVYIGGDMITGKFYFGIIIILLIWLLLIVYAYKLLESMSASLWWLAPPVVLLMWPISSIVYVSALMNGKIFLIASICFIATCWYCFKKNSFLIKRPVMVVANLLYIIILYLISLVPHIYSVKLYRYNLLMREILPIILWSAIFAISISNKHYIKVSFKSVSPSLVVCALPFTSTLFVFFCWGTRGFAP